MIKDLSQFREKLKQEHIYINFAGPLSQSLMEDVVGIVRRRMTLEGENTATVMNVFAIAVEQVQNMIHYSAEMIPDDEKNAEFRFGLLVVGREDERYVVCSGNLIRQPEIAALRERLTKLGDMNKDSLKQYYKEQRKKTPDLKAKGAGLGLIEIARKSSRPLEFDFQPVDDDSRSFFSLKAII